MTNQQNERSNNGKRIVLIMLAILLIAAIAFGAYTYSKYVTSKDGSTSAPVAKWGFTVTMQPGDADGDIFGFSQYYSNDGTAANAEANIIDGASGNVVAPGTKGSFTFSVSGTAEVQAKITADLTVTNDVALVMEKKSESPTNFTYNPVRFTLSKAGEGGQYTAVDGGSNLTLKELETTVEGLFANDNTINPGEDAKGAGTYKIEWAWAYESENFKVNESLTLDSKDNVNALDTLLGKASSSNFTGLTDDKVTINGATYVCDVDNDANSTTLAFSLKISVEQTGITPGN